MRAQPTVPAITVEPVVPGSVDLRLLDVSDGRLALARDGGSLLTGETGLLREVGEHRQLAYAYAEINDLQGEVLRWSEAVGEQKFVLHTVNLSTGVRTAQRIDEAPMAWTPQGWIGLRDGTLTQHEGETERVLFKGVPDDDLLFWPWAVSDGERTMLSYSPNDDVPLRVVLITDGGAQVETLGEVRGKSGELISGMALTPQSEVWIGSKYGKVTVHRRDRTTGRVADVPVPGLNGEDLPTVAADDETIVVKEDRGFLGEGAVGRLRRWDGSAWTTLKLAGSTSEDIKGLGGFALDDGSVYLSVSGAIDGAAGVYRVDADGQAQRVATAAGVRSVFAEMALSGGRLYFTERRAALPVAYDVPLYSRTLLRTPGGDLAGLGARAAEGPVTDYPDRKNRPTFSVSGDRIMVGPGRRELWSSFIGPSFVIDRLKTVKQSGAYLLGSGKLYAANPARSDAVLTAQLDLKTQPADLFGPRVLWRTRAGRVLFRNVLNGRSSRELVASGASGPVAIWRNRFAWLDERGRIGVRALAGGKTRYLAADSVRTLSLSEQVLSWTDSGGGVHLLDLTRKNSQPVETGLRTPYQIDGDLLAGLDESGNIRVEQLPFSDRNIPPRLISAVAPKTVGAGTEWTAQFDVTGPVRQARLQIRRDGRVVRTLTGQGRHNLIEIDWNARTSTGKKVKPGRYQFILKGVEPTEGRGTVRGVLRVTR
ncbi:flagellar hook assembly protein FlgD [Kineosporia babensis]|uniref:FlgD Ig-like domain-containing protein n=1 Tax=Kineosporia babensis TaxID=499548 RepID=A0A9X1NLN6_9ACTN|nr:hypothetical protein [Kineosporia babensis]MCD5316079.1 hypothetical protein [Kineosporia babensis]